MCDCPEDGMTREFRSISCNRNKMWGRVEAEEGGKGQVRGDSADPDNRVVIHLIISTLRIK